MQTVASDQNSSAHPNTLDQKDAEMLSSEDNDAQAEDKTGNSDNQEEFQEEQEEKEEEEEEQQSAVSSSSSEGNMNKHMRRHEEV